MTGFLQRLATNIRAPSRLHPFVGSRFAGSPPETAAAALPRGDSIAASEDQVAAAPTSATAADHASRAPKGAPPEPTNPPPTARALPARVRHLDEQPIDHEREDAPDAHARRPNDAGAARASFRSLLTREEAETEVKGSAAKSGDGLGARPGAAPSHPLGAAPSHPLAPLCPARATPLVEPAARHGETEGPPAPVPVASARLKPAGDEWPAPAGLQQPSGDDIHIHIGRVEVTAVPPPTPRPVAAPARKTMTLEEYLGRRNGASR
jgi:hypothetical protein